MHKREDLPIDTALDVVIPPARRVKPQNAALALAMAYAVGKVHIR